MLCGTCRMRFRNPGPGLLPGREYPENVDWRTRSPLLRTLRLPAMCIAADGRSVARIADQAVVSGPEPCRDPCLARKGRPLCKCPGVMLEERLPGKLIACALRHYVYRLAPQPVALVDLTPDRAVRLHVPQLRAEAPC